MNTLHWRDVPHLFANGEFRFKARGRVIDKMINYNPTVHMFNFTDPIWSQGKKAKLIAVSECTLIARSIDSMTGEEREVYESFPLDQDVEAFLYLISRGILPEEFSNEGVQFVDKKED